MLLTQSNTFIIGWIAKLLGYVMELIFRVMNQVGIVNLGVCIILFTIVVKLAMLPLTIKQQHFSKINTIMQPEINKIQKRYRNKKDQESMMRQNEEIQAVYEKYGVSPTGSCLQLIIQMPIIFALYYVIRNIPAYIQPVKQVYEVVVNAITSVAGYEQTLTQIGESAKLLTKLQASPSTNQVIDFLAQFKPDTWKALADAMPSISDTITTQASTIANMNNFLWGINIAETPSFSKPVYLIIPVAAGLFQWLSMKTMNTNTDDNPQLAAMNRTMMFMPLMSVWFCFTLPSGIGIYWSISALFQVIQQIVINKYMDHIDVNKLIEKNQKKAAKKKKKKKKSLTTRLMEGASQNTTNTNENVTVTPSGRRVGKMTSRATMNTKNMNVNYDQLYPLDQLADIPENKQEDAGTTKKKKKKGQEGGSIAANANLMRKYNETHGKGGNK